jgi:serine/threonine protein kinase
MHQENVYHRDIHPDNIIINPKNYNIKFIDLDTICLDSIDCKKDLHERYLQAKLYQIHNFSSENFEKYGYIYAQDLDYYSIGIVILEILNITGNIQEMINEMEGKLFKSAPSFKKPTPEPEEKSAEPEPSLSQEEECINYLSCPFRLFFSLLFFHGQLNLLVSPWKLLLSFFLQLIFVSKLVLLKIFLIKLLFLKLLSKISLCRCHIRIIKIH